MGELRTGRFNKSLLNTIKNSVLFRQFVDPYAQLTSVILCREHFKKILAFEKDNVYGFMRIVGEAAKKDSDFAKIRFELFSKQHVVIKDLHYAPTMKHDWLQWQQTVLDAEGHQSGSGQQRVCEIVTNMPYAPTRAGVEADCYEVLCRTMKATLSTMADKVNKRHNRRSQGSMQEDFGRDGGTRVVVSRAQHRQEYHRETNSQTL